MKKIQSALLVSVLACALSLSSGEYVTFGETADLPESVTEAAAEQMDGIDGRMIFGDLVSAVGLDGEPFTYYKLTEDEYELAADTRIEGVLVVSSQVTVKLNGYSLTRTDTSEPRLAGCIFILTGEESDLTVIGGGGTLSGGNSLYSGGCIGEQQDAYGTKVTIRDTTIENCRSDVPIGAISADYIDLEGCTIQNCSAEGTGAIGVYEDGTAILKDCIIRNCSAVSGSVGAVEVGENADLTMDNCLIDNCTAGTYCGAVNIATGHTGTVTIKDSTITNCSANSDTLGMAFDNCGTLILSGKVIIRDNGSSGENNYSQDNLAMGGGGTIDASGLTDGSYIGIYHSSNEDRNALDAGILVDDLGADAERVASYFHVDDEDRAAEIKEGEDGQKQLWMR